MALHRYLAVSPGEKPHEVMIEADDPAEALRKLRGRHLTPVKYLGEDSAGQGKKNAMFRRNRIDIYIFTRQLTPLMNSYIPLEKALAIIAESSSEGEQRDFVNSLRQGLHEGKKFSELVRSHGSLFPDYYANLIESGEETGCLPDVLTHLYSFMGESRELKSFIVSSSVYP